MPPTILFLHAFPLGGRMWAEHRTAVAERGFPVAAPDLSGADACASYADTARRLLAAHDGALVPVGASMGGHLAFELWRQARARIAALVLSGTRATPDTPEQRQSRDRLISVLEERGTQGLAETMASLPEQARAILLEQPASGLAATLRAMRDRPDSTPLLAGIDVPVLVLTGRGDHVIPPEQARALADALPDARYREIEGGHMAPLERASEFTVALLEFLDEIGLGGRSRTQAPLSTKEPS